MVEEGRGGGGAREEAWQGRAVSPLKELSKKQFPEITPSARWH